MLFLNTVAPETYCLLKQIQALPEFAEARSICLGRSELRLPSRLCGKTTLAVLRRSRHTLTPEP